MVNETVLGRIRLPDIGHLFSAWCIDKKNRLPLALATKNMLGEKTDTIYELIRTRAEHTPQAAAILAPDRSVLTYRALLTQIDWLVKFLRMRGVRRNDRVAIVLPNGAEMAVVCLAVAAAATCAPLNPDISPSEFDFYLSDLEPKVLIIESSLKDSAIGLHRTHAIPTLELRSEPATAAGMFTLSKNGQPLATVTDFPRGDDIALILHTSGTTSRPKLVPLTHANLLVSAQNIVSTLRLTARDCCLNVMPLFHIHGLVGALLSSVMAGSSVVCASSFDPEQFFPLLEKFRPTWYTAVPTIHHAILSHAQLARSGFKNHSLRFIRSSSAALPVQVMQGLEHFFDIPVIESYGMTEASHQVASNPLPPAERKPRSVGKAAGPEIAILNDEGHLQPAGTTGEVAIRGANVVAGYATGRDTVATSFPDGWLRTGDQGYLDRDGYLFLTGRIKELINRGGEKFAPREIDDVLLAHPAVDQAAAFAVAHPTLGQEVAAVVALRPGSQATVKQLKEFSADHLADFKVPKHIVIVDNLPKNATGKLQRLGLAEKLIVPLSVDEDNDGDGELERKVAGIFAETLGLESVGSADNFFVLGGDSLRATQVIARIHDTLGINISKTTLLLHSTVRDLAHEILGVIATTDDLWSTYPSSVVPFRSTGSKPPLFWFNWGYWDFRLPQYLGSDQPVYGLQHQSRDGQRALHTTIEEMAAYYISELRTVQAKGPYFLGGLCIGGMVAFEMAQQLSEQNDAVALVVLLDPRNRNGELLPVHRDSPTTSAQLRCLRSKINRRLREVSSLDPQSKLRYVLDEATSRINRFSDKINWLGRRTLCEVFGHPLPASLRTKYIECIYDRAAQNYLPKLYRGQVVIFKTHGRYHSGQFSWGNFITDASEIKDLDIDHENVFKEPYVQVFAETLKARLSEAQKTREKH